MDSIINALISDRLPLMYPMPDPTKEHLSRNAALAAMERSLTSHSDANFQVPFTGPVTMPEVDVPPGLTYKEIGTSYNYRIGLILQPKNPGMHARLVT